MHVISTSILIAMPFYDCCYDLCYFIVIVTVPIKSCAIWTDAYKSADLNLAKIPVETSEDVHFQEKLHGKLFKIYRSHAQICKKKSSDRN